jgi:TP901-1 family phage major tail protein
MSAHRGKDLLLKISDGGAPPVFTTVAGLRARTLSLNAREVDVTHAESAGGWRELLAGAGVRQASVSGAGVFLDGAAADALRAAFFAGEARVFEITLPGLGVVMGPFLIANLDYAGDHEGEATVSIALASAGALSFEALP